MDAEGTDRPSFRIDHEARPSGTLLAGFSAFGLAGLTAVDYLVDQLGLEETGHVTAEELPTITPFEAGRPRHHTRLYSDERLEVTLLVNELFVPVGAAGPFADAVLDWTDRNGIEEVAVVAGIPVAHGPDAHRVFYVATEDYRAHRLEGTDIPPMGNGFLDGVNASLVSRGMDTTLRAGVLVTPVHARAPDVEAAIRLVDAASRLYGLDVETDELERFAADVEQYYRDLSERLQDVEEGQLPEDRMYM